MNQYRGFFIKAAAILLAAVISCISVSGCSSPEEAPSPENTNTPCETHEQVQIGTIRCDKSAQELTVTDPDAAQLRQILPLLSDLKVLTLDGTRLPVEELLRLKEQFPALSLNCIVPLGEKEFSTEDPVLDLSDTSIDFKTLSRYLPLFYKLQKLILTGTNLSDAEKMSLCDSFHNMFVLCELPVAGRLFSTDCMEIDISHCPVTVDEIEGMLPYFPFLQKLDMSFCGISDEEMDALNQQHPDISIVWTVNIGMAKTRTDAIYFYPAEINYYPTNEEMKKLQYCTELVAVDIGHTRATDCEFLRNTPKVRYLILADTGITDITPVGNLKELIYLELFNLRLKDYSPLLNCTKLQDLNIGTTHADPAPLRQMTWLHNLQWHRADQNPDTKEAVLKLPEQLPDTNVELYPRKKARNIGGFWRYLPNYYVFRDIIGADYFNQDQIGDYWGQEDGQRIMACNGGNAFAAYTLAEIVRERIDKGIPIIGIKDIESKKAEILFDTLMEAESWITER